MWGKQERFLAAYAKCGKIGVAAKAIGITRWAVDYWRSTDAYAFKKRLEAAHKDYVELLEQDLDDWIGETKHNTQIARIFRLKAEDPEKYREEVKVLNADAPFEMLDKLKEMAIRERERQGALEAPAVEAVYRDITPRQEPVVETPAPRAEAPLPAPQPRESARDRRAAQVRASRAARGRPPGRFTRR
jgi:hypothetical protein